MVSSTMVIPMHSSGGGGGYDRYDTNGGGGYGGATTGGGLDLPPCPQCCNRPRTTQCIGGRGSTHGHRGAYLIIVLIPYILLVLLFHSQLQLYDTRPISQQQKLEEDEGAFIGIGDSNPNLNEPKTHHVRDLTLNTGPQKLQTKTKTKRFGLLVSVNNHTHPKYVVRPTKPLLSTMDRHIQELLELDQQGRQRDMFESRWNKSSVWSSIYPIHPKCQDYKIVKDVPTVRFRPIQGHWVYTAYYDPRLNPPVLRVILLVRKATSPPAFHCHFDYKSKVISVIPEYYEMCENHAKDYGGWILTCKVPPEFSDSPPCEVTISARSLYQPDDETNTRVPVFSTETPQKQKQEFGVCIPPIFGYIPSTTLVEFIEMTKLLGASHLVFYAHQVSREIQKVLRFYDQLGIVTVIHWDLPLQEKQIWYHGQLLAINDCLYRNMHRFKYLAFNDLDEFIVPHSPGARNWTHMIEAIEQVARLSPPNVENSHDADDKNVDKTLINSDLNNDPAMHCGYSFHSAFFDPLSSGSRVLYDLESDLRTKSLSIVRTKTMVRPDRMFELGIHHISRPISTKYKAYYVSPKEAYVHHYRKCVADFDPKMNCQVYARDETLSPYIPTLRHNVHQALWILKEREKLQI